MKNNTLNIGTLDKVLDKLMLDNFNNLCDLQLNMLRMKSFKLKMQDFKKTSRVPGLVGGKRYYPSRYIANVEYSLVNTNKRRVFRSSDLYNKYIDFMDICKNRHLFAYNYLLFIDGKLVRTTEVFPDEHTLGVIIDVASTKNIDGIPLDAYLDYVERNVDVEVVIIPNYTYGIVATNRVALSNRGFTIPYERITNREDLSKTSMMFMNDDENDTSAMVMVPFELTEEGVNVLIDPKTIPKTVMFMVLNPNRLTDTVEVNGDYPYFVIDKQSPVPIEHIKVYTKSYHRDWYTLDDRLTVEFYYPNIYKINGLIEIEEALVQVFYKDFDDEKYFNELGLFYKYSTGILEMYQDDTIPEIIKNYKPCDLEYSINDYNKTHFPKSILDYKLSKIKYLVDNDSQYLNNYIIASLEKANNYLVKCENMNLVDRIRHNTFNELDNTEMVFDEPHYVFGFNYHVLDVVKNSIRLFIDGYYTHDNDYLFFGTDLAAYIYVPCRLIKDKSILEIERYWDYVHRSVAIPLSSKHKIQTTINGSDCRVKNIFVTDSKGYYLSRDDYEVYLDDEPYPTESNVKVHGIVSIAIINEKYHNDQVNILVINDCDADAYSEPVDIPNQIINTESISNNRSSNYRIFKNGQLLPEAGFEVHVPNKSGQEVSVIVKTINKKGDKLVVDYTPCDFKVKYTQKYIDDPKGYVAIPYGKIDKPISLRWFDIYVNGIKLNKTNIEIISPTKFYIQGIKSRKNLVIMERDRDNELISLGPDNSDSINDAIIDIPGFKDKVDETLDDVHDILPDIIGDIIDDIILDLIKFMELCLRYTFIKPDLRQITNEIIDEYNTILTQGEEFIFDGNHRGEGDIIPLRLDCNDIAVEPKDTDGKTIEEVGGMAERFAIGPLSTENKDLALRGELLINTVSGDCAICTTDGVVSPTRLSRMNTVVEKLRINAVRNSITVGSIAELEPDNVHYPQVIQHETNLLDGSIYAGSKKIMIHIDIDVLSSDNKQLVMVEDTVMVNMVYRDAGNERRVELPLHEFNNTAHSMAEGSEILHISLSEPTGNANLIYIVHFILLTVNGEV